MKGLADRGGPCDVVAWRHLVVLRDAGLGWMGVVGSLGWCNDGGGGMR
jgi:hypothetical protein